MLGCTQVATVLLVYDSDGLWLLVMINVPSSPSYVILPDLVWCVAKEEAVLTKQGF